MGRAVGVRMRETAVYIVLLALLFLFFAALAEAKKPKPQVARAIFIGDSITRGTGANEPLRTGFVGTLQRLLPRYHLVNAGCGGALIQAWTADTPALRCWWGSAWATFVEPYYPAVWTHVLLGGAHLPQSLPAYEWELEMRTLVERIPGCVIISMRPIDPSHRNDHVAIRHGRYREAVRRVVADYERVEVGVNFWPLLDPETDFADSVHPNQRGYEIMAYALLGRLWELETSKDFCRKGFGG